MSSGLEIKGVSVSYGARKAQDRRLFVVGEGAFCVRRPMTAKGDWRAAPCVSSLCCMHRGDRLRRAEPLSLVQQFRERILDLAR